MGFEGWPEAALEFFEGLERDNTKDYWTAHRETYDRDVRGPMDALLAELQPEFGAAKVFRPYRDVRFTADKSPYKTECSAVAEGGYVAISADGLFAARGYYMLDRDQLERYREAVAADTSGPEAEKLVAEAEGAGYEVSGEALKSAPRGYPRDHPRIRLLRHKGLYLWRRDPEVLHRPEAVGWVAETWRAAGPLNEWFDRYVGPSATA